MRTVPTFTNRLTQMAATQWSRRDSGTAGRDLYAAIAFCLVGLLLTLNFILRFPDLGAVIQQYNQF